MKTTKEEKLVSVQIKIDAPVDLVWKLFTTPEDIKKWNNASEDWHTPRALNDLREGGRFNYRMEAINGKEGFDFEGVYTKIIPMERIEYTISDGRKAIVSFLKSNGSTRIIEDFEPENINSVQKQHDGWQSILINFKHYAQERAAFSKPPKVTHQIAPCLWFNNNAAEAVNFYTSVFKNSKILKKSYYTNEGYEIHKHKPGDVLTIDFEINGQSFTALNGGPEFKFSEGVSFQVFCDTQQEIDYYWARLSDGGEEGQCGWLKDRYGLSWQIVPAILPKLITDPSKAERVMRVMMPMRKLDLEKIRAV
ncbi:MAG: VOC family protein [Bacteroidales bacterium]